MTYKSIRLINKNERILKATFLFIIIIIIIKFTFYTDIILRTTIRKNTNNDRI